MALPKEVKRWAYYSFANHSYQVVYLSFLLPVFFSTVLAGKYSLGIWGTINGFSTVFGVILALMIGRYSDAHSKLQAFKWSIIASAMGMTSIALATKYFSSHFVIFLFLTNAIFIWSLSLFDSILPHISNSKNVYEYGGFSWGFGYIGGVMSLILALILQKFTSQYSLLVFLSVPVFYLIFSFYSLTGLGESKLNTTERTHKEPVISKKSKRILFLGYWLISECITVITLFASLYLTNEMHLSLVGVGIALLAIQIIGFPATWWGGRLAEKYNVLHLLAFTMALWGGGVVALLLLNLKLTGLAIAILFIGCAYGNTQSYMRSQYSVIIERSESGFQFGIYSIISEAAVFVGPIIFGYASDKLHSQRIPLLVLYLCMLSGYGLVWKVMHNVKIDLTNNF